MIDVYYLNQGGLSSDLLLRCAAARFTGLDPAEFETVRKYGKKPFFRIHPEIHASVSHSGGIWAAALTREGPVGLDIQLLRISPRRESIARRYFHPEEAAAVSSSPDPDAAFSRIWCRKEAAVKLSGRGIDGDFSSFDTTAPEPISVFGSPLYLRDFRLPGREDIFACAAHEAPFILRLFPLKTDFYDREARLCCSTPSNS